jgi:hypothetical protein
MKSGSSKSKYQPAGQSVALRKGTHCEGCHQTAKRLAEGQAQVVGHQPEFPMSFVEKAAPNVHPLTKNGKNKRRMRLPWTTDGSRGR